MPTRHRSVSLLAGFLAGFAVAIGGVAGARWTGQMGQSSSPGMTQSSSFSMGGALSPVTVDPSKDPAADPLWQGGPEDGTGVDGGGDADDGVMGGGDGQDADGDGDGNGGGGGNTGGNDGDGGGGQGDGGGNDEEPCTTEDDDGADGGQGDGDGADKPDDGWKCFYPARSAGACNQPGYSCSVDRCFMFERTTPLPDGRSAWPYCYGSDAGSPADNGYPHC